MLEAWHDDDDDDDYYYYHHHNYYNYDVKVNREKMQQNSKCKLCGDKDEMINHTINKCNKITQKEY